MSKLLFAEKPSESLKVGLIFEDEKIPFAGAPGSFKGKKLETLYLPTQSTFIVGLGKKKDVEIDYYRRAGAKAVKTASAYKIPSVHFLLANPLEKNCLALLEGACLANYAFDKYKEKDEKMFRVKHYSFPLKAKSFSTSLEKVIAICENVYMVRNLVNDNSNVVNPELMEKLSRKISKKSRIKFSVLHEAQLKKLGLNLLLGVGKGSLVPSRLIILDYKGNKSNPKHELLFVGKGITFDSGGLNIKTGESMKDMHMDMAGAATVLGIIKSAAELKLKKNIVALLPCAENLIDSKSQRPGDIIESYSGKTVENSNTDAEGRLVLADALAYGVKKYKPELIVEYSTLTGAVSGTFGQHCAGMVSNNEEYSDRMFKAGLETYERVWKLPLFDEYLDEVKGERSDLRSMNKKRHNGTIFAGAFLSKFVGETPFLHLDVAGTAMLDEATDYNPKDGSGFGVRLAIRFLEEL